MVGRDPDAGRLWRLAWAAVVRDSGVCCTRRLIPQEGSHLLKAGPPAESRQPGGATARGAELLGTGGWLPAEAGYSCWQPCVASPCPLPRYLSLPRPTNIPSIRRWTEVVVRAAMMCRVLRHGAGVSIGTVVMHVCRRKGCGWVHVKVCPGPGVLLHTTFYSK